VPGIRRLRLFSLPTAMATAATMSCRAEVFGGWFPDDTWTAGADRLFFESCLWRPVLLFPWGSSNMVTEFAMCGRHHTCAPQCLHSGIRFPGYLAVLSSSRRSRGSPSRVNGSEPTGRLAIADKPGRDGFGSEIRHSKPWKFSLGQRRLRTVDGVDGVGHGRVGAHQQGSRAEDWGDQVMPQRPWGSNLFDQHLCGP